MGRGIAEEEERVEMRVWKGEGERGCKDVYVKGHYIPHGAHWLTKSQVSIKY